MSKNAKNDMTKEACAGYAGNENPYLPTSPNWYAHELGKYFKASGRTVPRDVRMGRGDSIRGNDMRFAFRMPNKSHAIEFERVE